MKFKLCDGVTIEHIEGQNILITKNGDVAVFNETAGYALNIMLNDHADVDVAIQKLSARFSVSLKTAREDVEVFLNACTEKELLAVI